MFFILEGEGELRFGDARYPSRRNDVIACPTGGAEVAHQIINTGTVELRYLAVSNLVDVEACEFPDSGKLMVVTGRPGEPGMWVVLRAGGARRLLRGRARCGAARGRVSTPALRR